MCTKITTKETNPRKTIWAYKVFNNVNHRPDGPPSHGLFSTWVDVTYLDKEKGVDRTGIWLTTKRPGFHAYLSLAIAKQEHANALKHIKRVRLRKIRGYGPIYSWQRRTCKDIVVALEMWIPKRNQTRPPRTTEHIKPTKLA
jgi:hypothetical protein